MADTSPNLEMPFILPSQAQKHVTHNEALLRLDALVHLTILAEQPTPPPSPDEGACYLVAASAAGAWDGRQGRIACWQDGAWSFIQPRLGWRAWFAGIGRLKVFSGSAWQDIPLPQSGSLDQLGIGATPDVTNRLALASPASLFNHAGSGHQIKVNKAAGSDTASLLFQSNWTGYAEMGLAGNNQFSIKVSDGTSWKTALAVTGAGHVSKPAQPVARAFRPGTTFTPTAGQQSGFTDFGLNQGGFALGGSAAAAGGFGIVVPAAGIYQISLNLALASSSGHGATVLKNGTQTLLSVAGSSGAAQTQSAIGIFALAASDVLTLGHSGIAEIQLGSGKTEISLVMI
ncbi:DUF2793 domain-containing protein [Neorhizobium lilium]|uniref:DUF2793 domain-containing protein n=1 Tax=Neorhizobium lilium TaxID=2503024 RepID=A0A3S3SF96_9HYPH|nr:DUF2793 domain-containing protein [Neorhizobium lilium]RWX78911.1 DUF2793 domain-containing protein [Neorhizobium lilium]